MADLPVGPVVWLGIRGAIGCVLAQSDHRQWRGSTMERIAEATQHDNLQGMAEGIDGCLHHVGEWVTIEEEVQKLGGRTDRTGRNPREEPK